MIPNKPARGLLRRWAPYLAAACIAALLIAVAFFVIPGWRKCGLFSSMARTDDGECIGIVDSPDVLDQQMQDVARRIQAENEAAASHGPYVKIVLLTSLSLSPDCALANISWKHLMHSLEGAYTALYRVNHGSDFGDPAAPKVQMLLANHGCRQDQEYSDKLTTDIIDRSEPEHPVVAVVGLGSSLPGTEEVIRILGNQGIPTVTAVAAADKLDIQIFPRLRSVSPGTIDYVAALKHLLDGHHPNLDLRSGMIVADQSEEAFVTSLRDAFTTIMAPYIKFPGGTFIGGTLKSKAEPKVFTPVVANICNTYTKDGPPLDMVFYAGRVSDFEAFARAMENRVCKQKPLAIIVGATGFQVAEGYKDILKSGNITVVYASSSDSPTWLKQGVGTPGGFSTFADEHKKRGFDEDSLTDGYAIMYHDAVVSTSAAVRLAALGDKIPGPADVDVQFGNLNQAFAVRAASGTLEFGIRPNGRAAGKPVVIRQIGSDTIFQLPSGVAPDIVR